MMEIKRKLPKEIITANGEFDLYDPELIGEWSGRVFAHPKLERKAYDEYLEKFAKHGNGILLIHVGTDSANFQKWVLKRAHAIFFISGRFHYLNESGNKEKDNCGKAMCFVAYGQQNSISLKYCKLPGIYVPFIRKYTKKKETQTEKFEL